ncbi:MAG: hypothetical protein FJ278_13460, partial [Planctomycetes bacterium]|nr:hypothetical protein [Planctomycetota bacterium]
MRRVACLFALGLAVLPASLYAHWVEHKRLPEWAQRGAMRSCVCPFDHGWLRAWLDADPLACNFTVLFTEQTAWEDPRTPTKQLMDTYVRPRNGHLFFYTCPNSIYYDDHFEREDWNDNMAFSRYRWDNFHRQPYAKDCINYNKDGQPTIAYLLPSMRHRTSYFATQWAEHEKQIVDYMVKGKAAVTNEYLRKHMRELKHPGIMDGFYFDNAGMRIDWGPLAMECWKKVSQERFGKVIDPKTSDDLAVRMAWLDMQYRAYFEFHEA